MKAEYKPLITKEELLNIKKGDVLERMLAFSIPVYIIVQKVTEDVIDAGWTFNRHTGLEIDDDISTTVSYIRRVLTEEQKEIIKQGGKLDDI